MRFLSFVLFLTVSLLVVGAAAQAAEPLGTVERLQGTANATRAAAVLPLTEGTALERGDVLRTDVGARLRVSLRDGSVLTLGEEAELTLNDAVVPTESSPDGPFMDLISGAFRLVAAKVNQGEDRVVRTPVATIGIRGTDFWGGSLTTQMDVLVLEGAVAVTTQGGEVLLDDPGEGTHVPAADAPPEPVGRWGDAMVARAFATVTFEGE